jgi:hypothetical protein
MAYLGENLKRNGILRADIPADRVVATFFPVYTPPQESSIATSQPYNAKRAYSTRQIGLDG